MAMEICECGCGGELELRPHHIYYGIPRFLPGHHMRGRQRVERETRSCSTCGGAMTVRVTSTRRFCSRMCKNREQSAMMHTRNPSQTLSPEALSERSRSVSRSLKGKVRTDPTYRAAIMGRLPLMWERSRNPESRLRQGRTLAGRYQRHELVPVWQGKHQPSWMIEKRVAPLRGRRMSEATRRTLGQSLRASAQGGKLRDWYRSERFQEMVVASGRKTWLLHRSELVPFFNPSIGSKLEERLAERLRLAGLEVGRNVALLGWGRTVPDYVVRCQDGSALLVYMDGCFRHGCTEPTCKSGRADPGRRLVPVEVARKKDERQTRMLLDRGFRVLRVWEHEVRRSMEDVVRRIVDASS